MYRNGAMIPSTHPPLQVIGLKGVSKSTQESFLDTYPGLTSQGCTISHLQSGWLAWREVLAKTKLQTRDWTQDLSLTVTVNVPRLGPARGL